MTLPRGRWLIDGNNVMGSRPDGWWRDRAGAARRLAAAVAAHPWPEGTEVTLVFDGAEPDPEAHGQPDASGGRAPWSPVEVVHAGRGSSADDRLVEVARASGGTVTVVTSDRALAARLREVGATVVPAGRFLALLEGGADDPRR